MIAVRHIEISRLRTALHRCAACRARSIGFINFHNFPFMPDGMQWLCRTHYDLTCQIVTGRSMSEILE